MENKNMIKLSYDFFHSSPGYMESGRLGSLIINPRFLEFWVVLKDGEMGIDDDLILELIDSLDNKRPPYTIEDFTSEEVMDSVSDFYSWDSLDMGARLEVKAEEVDFSTVEKEKISRVNIPKDLMISGISDLDLFLIYSDF